MLEHPQVLDNHVTPDSTVGRVEKRRFLSESGVYARLALAIESFGRAGWDDEDDEQDAVTLVRIPPVATVVDAVAERSLEDDAVAEEKTWIRLPRAHVSPRGSEPRSHSNQLHEAVLVEADSVVDNESVRPQSTLSMRQAACFQVALHLRGEELARFWAREGGALAGRAYLWSQESQSWARLDGTQEVHEVLPIHGQPSQSLPCSVDAARERLATPNAVFLGASSARLADWGFVALGAAAALSVVLCLSRFVGYPSLPAAVTAGERPVAAERTPNRDVSRARATNEISSSAELVGSGAKSTKAVKRMEVRQETIPVTALPLVSKRSAPRTRIQG